MRVSLVKQIASMDNLMLAWRKIENLFIPGDIWFDPLRLAAFKYRLKDNLEQISCRLEAGTYQMQELKPVPFPKKKGEDDEIPPIRQSFIIDVADQLVWVAVCNVIGARLDTRMPAWSYGNRLYLYWWKDSADKWQIGNYRNSTPTLYRNWNQSWPQMKRKITVSLKKMSFTGELDEEEEKVLIQEQDTTLDYAKLRYLRPDYFNQLKGNPTDTLFWMGIDLKKFYPNVSISKTKQIIIRELKAADDADFVALLDRLCSFILDIRDYEGKEANLKLMDIDVNDDILFKGLPTGLLVSGFLANVFMLDIDRKVDLYLDKHRDVIHFRYVDDHVFIGRTPEVTKRWIVKYIGLLQENGLEINIKKSEPKGVLIKDRESYLVDVKKLELTGAIDPFYPTPLMTQTLQKVSMLSKERLPLLSGSEFNLVFKDLQTMLVTDIPETEIKKATRISFACTMLSRMMRGGQIDYHEVYVSRRRLFDGFSQGEERSRTRKKELQKWIFRDDFSLTEDEKAYLKDDECDAFYHLQALIEEGNKKTEALARNIFGLLMRSLSEVPDKVKIWVRAFLFAINHYPDGIDLIRRHLQTIEKRQSLHHLSVLYLESIIEFLSAEAIQDIISHLYLNDYNTAKERKRDEKALWMLLVPPYPDEGFQFKALSSMALKKAQKTYQRHCGQLGLKPIDCFSPPSEEYEYEDGTVLDSTFWEIWKMEAIDTNGENDVAVSKLVDVESVKLFSPYLEGYLFKVLSILPRFNEENHDLFPQGIPVDLLSPELQYALRMFAPNNKVFSIKKQVRSQHRGMVSLFDWITRTEREMSKLIQREDALSRRELMNKVQFYEIFSVKLMHEIVKRVKWELGNDTGVWSFRRLHPMNIYLSKKAMTDPQWSLVLENTNLKVELFDDDVSGAEVYYETKNTGPITLPVHFTVCYSLGLIFLHLLTRKMYFPWIMNNPNYGYEWRRELNLILNRGEVSSINFKIVEACLSIWNRESVYLRKALEPELFVEDKSRSVEIFSLDDLEEWIEQSFQQMRKNLISVPNHQYRQLIEITVS